VAYEIAPHQNGMVAIMIPQIRFSDRPLSNAKDTPEPAILGQARSLNLQKQGYTFKPPLTSTTF
jgi:hypothetical protein